MSNLTNVFGPVISRYSRADAIGDGVLIDLMAGSTRSTLQDDTDALVREAGFRFPIAMTATAFSRVVWPIDSPQLCSELETCGQDLKGRLWDVLWMMKLAIRRSAGSRVDFAVSVITGTTRTGKPIRRTVRLKSLCGPGDDAEPVITIMLPEED